MYDLENPGAPILRSADEAKKRDRRPVIRYGRPGTRDRYGRTEGETILLNRNGDRHQDRYLMATIDDRDASTDPLSTRPSLVRLTALVISHDVGVLLEGPRVSTDVRAVLAELASRRDHPTALIDTREPGSRRRSYTRSRNDWQDHMDPDERDDVLRSLVAEAAKALAQDITHRGTLKLLGCEDQPRRDFERAQIAGAALRSQGKTQTEVQNYLALHGFANATGTIGVWNHIDYTKLGI